MAYFRKCRTCARNPDCEIKDRLRDAIKGLGITSLLHKCDSFEPKYKAGDQVLVRTCTGYEGDPTDDYGNMIYGSFPGWFVSWTDKGKCLAYVTPGTPSIEDGREKFEPRNDGWCSVPMSRIESRPQDDPSPVCPKCGMVPNGDCANADNDAYWERRQEIARDCPMAKQSEGDA